MHISLQISQSCMWQTTGKYKFVTEICHIHAVSRHQVYFHQSSLSLNKFPAMTSNMDWMGLYQLKVQSGKAYILALNVCSTGLHLPTADTLQTSVQECMGIAKGKIQDWNIPAWQTKGKDTQAHYVFFKESGDWWCHSFFVINPTCILREGFWTIFQASDFSHWAEKTLKKKNSVPIILPCLFNMQNLVLKQ